MTRQRLRPWVFGLALLLGCSGGDDDGNTRQPPADTVGPLVAGTGGYVDGIYVWTDYAYDDRGANLTAVAGGDRNDSGTAGGDVRYPDTLTINNAADLIQLQIFTTGDGGLTVRAVVETLVDPALPVLAVAFDVDADPDTGAAELPGGGWPTAGALGVERILEIADPGARWWDYDGTSDTWIAGERFASSIDTDTNSLTATVAKDDIPGEVWRVAAAVGIDAGDGSWLEGHGAVFDLAFVGGEPFVRWQDNLQADILAGVLDASLAVVEIDAALLETGTTTITQSLPPGFHTLLYRSALELAEGIAYDEDASPIFLGPYQPYLVYVPEDLPSPSPLSLFLHGSDQNHLGSVFVQPGDSYLGTGRALSEDPYLIATLGYAGDGFDFPPHMLQVYPLARGGRLGYRGIAHQDALDVMTDTMARFDVDPDRVILQGASMGGIGTYRLATLQPDKWSVALPLIGFQSPDLLYLSINLFNLPIRQINGAADPLIPVAPADASADRLDELDYDYRYWLLTDRGHEAGGFVYDCVFAGAVDFVRNRHPARIRFVVDASFDEVDPASGLELRFDSAYWLAAIRPHDVTERAQVEALSSALPERNHTVRHIDRVVDNTETGADLCGPNPDIRTGDEWRERAVEIEPEPTATGNAVAMVLQNVASLSVDLPAAGIDVGADAEVAVTMDGGTTAVTLRGLRPGQTVQVDEQEVLADDEGSATVNVESPAVLQVRR